MHNSPLFKEVFYQSRIPQLIGCIDFTNMEFNPAFCDFLGYSMEELTELPIQVVSHPDDLDKDRQLFSEIVSNQRNEYQLEKRYIHKSGEIKTGILNVSRIKEQSTGQLFLLAQVLDITEKKHMEDALLNREQKYRLLAENSSDMIMLHSMDFSYHYISPSVKNVLGYEPEEMIGKAPSEFIHPDDYEEMGKHNHPFGWNNRSMLVTYRCRKKNGSYIWLESTIKALFDEETEEIREFTSVTRDIQQRMETNNRLQKSEKLAVVGQMAAAVAHEIRNPLTPIKGFMQLLNSEKYINPAFLRIILDELERVEAIISEFLSMAKPHTEKNMIVHLELVVKQVIQLLQTQALMKNKEINFSMENTLSSIMGDPNSLKQVFMNVIQNALDALSEKGRIDVSIHSDSAGIYVLIIDNGCGIPKERLAKLGEPFYSTKEKGTGLGLMTCYRIIESHNGKINIESNEGEGTSVTIWFPLAKHSN